MQNVHLPMQNLFPRRSAKDIAVDFLDVMRYSVLGLCFFVPKDDLNC